MPRGHLGGDIGARSGSSTSASGSSSPVGGISPSIPCQFLLEDVGRALVAGEQIGAVGGADERLQRVDAGEQADEIVLPAEREHRVDQVVADAGFALLDFETVGKKVEQLDGQLAIDWSAVVCTSIRKLDRVSADLVDLRRVRTELYP